MLELEWQQKMKEEFSAGADEKQVVVQTKERKRLDMMEKLKEVGGPFINSDMVKDFIELAEMSEKAKQKRLKLKVQFARESSTSTSFDFKVRYNKK